MDSKFLRIHFPKFYFFFTIFGSKFKCFLNRKTYNGIKNATLDFIVTIQKPRGLHVGGGSAIVHSPYKKYIIYELKQKVGRFRDFLYFLIILVSKFEDLSYDEISHFVSLTHPYKSPYNYGSCPMDNK